MYSRQAKDMSMNKWYGFLITSVHPEVSKHERTFTLRYLRANGS